MNVQNGISFLEVNGLNLYAVFDYANFPFEIKELISAENPTSHYKRLVLIGNAGNSLWPALQQTDMTRPDPVDTFSVETAQTFIDDYLDSAESQFLYPIGGNAPLQQLGKLAGWHHDSPLGLGIHSTYGVWFAYRVAFLTTAPLPLVSAAPSPSPCDTCLDKPCMSSCPAQAVLGIGRFDVPKCAAHRLSANSSCEDRCLSRLACPVGIEHQYPLEQVQYHYGQALTTFRKWFGDDS